MQQKSVTWDKDEAKSVFEQRNQVELLWIYALAVRPRTGTGAAQNYYSVTGKVQSKAKELGVDFPDDGELKQAFESLIRSDMLGPEGDVNSFIVGDKPEYIKLTRVGKNIINEVHSRESINRILKAELGVDFNEAEEWWPEEYDDDNAEVIMYTKSPRPDDDSGSYELEITAEFDCECCGADIEHEYSAEWPGEAYAQYAETDCPGCGTEWRHLKGQVYRRPKPV